MEIGVAVLGLPGFARLTYLEIKQIPSFEDWQSPGCKRLIDRELSS